MREVYINKQLVELDVSNQLEYYFESPIFRDISQILSNRTSTYKIPKTANNARIFGLLDMPDVVVSFPYNEHDFEEWRDGLLFIRGKCELLACNEAFELGVFWGNREKLLALKDKKLRDWDNDDYIRWNSDSKFLTADSEEAKKGFGFVVTDFGQGITDMSKIHPSVTVQYIIDHIVKNSGVEIRYPERFNEIFRKRWIPLFDKNAVASNWREHTAAMWMHSFYPMISYGYSYVKLNQTSGIDGLIGNVESNAYSYINVRSGIPMRIVLNFYLDDLNISQTDTYRLMITAISSGNILVNKFYNITRKENGKQTVYAYFNELIELNRNDRVFIRMSFTETEAPRFAPSSTDVINPMGTGAYVMEEARTISFGDKFVIAPNLPEMKVVDFLKSLMQMYGLFTHYNFKEDNVVEFFSIDDMYSKKEKAYDWTYRLIHHQDSIGARFYVKHRYGDYAQENTVDYKNDDEVINNKTKGVIRIDDRTLEPTKELFEVPYSASDNNADDNGMYAYIPFYDKEGDTQSVTTRILTQGDYGVDTPYISAHFDNEQKFGGDSGLVAKYYADYQLVLNRPKVVTFQMHLLPFEMSQFSELIPFYIDGVYYMLVKMTMQPNGFCKVDAIKMPPKD